MTKIGKPVKTGTAPISTPVKIPAVRVPRVNSSEGVKVVVKKSVPAKKKGE